MDLKTFVRRYAGCKITYKSEPTSSLGKLPASSHQRAAIKSLVLKGPSYMHMVCRALGLFIYEDKLTHDQAVKIIRAGNTIYKEVCIAINDTWGTP